LPFSAFDAAVVFVFLIWRKAPIRDMGAVVALSATGGCNWPPAFFVLRPRSEAAIVVLHA
jgi:hypothetical protein